MDRLRHIIVVGSNNLEASERWASFIASLDMELRASGLGELLDSPPLKGDTDQVQEAAIVLANAEYGLDLVDRAASEAGLPPRCSSMPQRWRAFNCEDYFASDLAERGHYDNESEYQYVLARDQIYEDDDRDFLVVGSPGCDGIEWGYRRGMAGIWAWYSIEAEFSPVAPGIRELLDGWLAGAIRI